MPPDRIWPGIAVYNQSLSAAESKIRDCRAAGLSGLSIYSYNSLPGGGKEPGEAEPGAVGVLTRSA